MNWNKQQCILNKDHLSIDFALKDRIKLHIFTAPSLETDVTYNAEIRQHFFLDQKIKFLKEFYLEFTDKNQEKGISINKFKMIGISNYFSQSIQYDNVFSTITEFSLKIYKFNIFIGKEVQCLAGVFFNLLIGKKVNENLLEKRLTGGLVLTFSTEFGTLKLYLSDILMGQTYFDQLQVLDFNIQGGAINNTNKRKYWKEEKSNLMISDM